MREKKKCGNINSRLCLCLCFFAKNKVPVTATTLPGRLPTPAPTPAPTTPTTTTTTTTTTVKTTTLAPTPILSLRTIYSLFPHAHKTHNFSDSYDDNSGANDDYDIDDETADDDRQWSSIARLSIQSERRSMWLSYRSRLCDEQQNLRLRVHKGRSLECRFVRLFRRLCRYDGSRRLFVDVDSVHGRQVQLNDRRRIAR